MTAVTAADVVIKEPGVRHRRGCQRNEGFQVLGFIALKTYMWTCLSCASVCTLNRLDRNWPGE